MEPGIAELLKMLPETARPFEDSEIPLPVSWAVCAGQPDLAAVRESLQNRDGKELKHLLEDVGVAAETIESQMPDRTDYFLTDAQVRGRVFGGGKHSAGWLLVVGDKVDEELTKKLKARGYMVFSPSDKRPPAKGKTEGLPLIPPRETGAVYFLQMMVRYAMFWGEIPPGEHHDMGHFLEDDMPGAMLAWGKVKPVEGLVLLSLMKLGCPAVVGPEFPYDIGPRAIAKNETEILEALGGFPNMRIKQFLGETIVLPEGADARNQNEKFETARTIEGQFQVRCGKTERGVTVKGPADANEIAIIVEIDDPAVDLPITAGIERLASSYCSYVHGVKSSGKDGAFKLEIGEDNSYSPELIGKAIVAGLRYNYLRMGPAHATILLGKEEIDKVTKEIEAYGQERAKAIQAETERTTAKFHICIDCQPFSKGHVCVITPDRPNMCNRNPADVKASARWGSGFRPYTRRDKADTPLSYYVEKGKTIDEKGGEYENLNKVVKELSGGIVERVKIHSVKNFPHTSCGCFRALAFSIPGTDWLGVVDRGYQGPIPGDLSWSKLANMAGGKQKPGVTGIGPEYMRGVEALAGDGGHRAVKWATKKVLEFMKPHLSPDSRVATEDDATTLEELKAFLREKAVAE